MGNRNTNLQRAKNAKNDEFFTTYEDIEREVSHYVRHFVGKTVYCNCDDPRRSNFCRYFLRNFNVLGLKRLICTSLSETTAAGDGLLDLRTDHEPLLWRQGRVLDVQTVGTGQEELSDDFIDAWLSETQCIQSLIGDGDFRSRECRSYLRAADIVVTNPPFSLFRELVVMLVRRRKKFLLVGNQNALTYKEIFPLIQKNKVWTGYQFGEMKFHVPADSEMRETRSWVDADGQKWRSLGNAMWLTNLDIPRRHERLPITRRFTPEEYPRYDSYDAVNVRRITDIPKDYAGVMGVPITVINRYNAEQLEIVGEANHGSDNEFDLFKPTINGRLLFKRILVKNRKPE